MKNKIVSYIKSPKKIMLLILRRTSRYISNDELYLKKYLSIYTGVSADLKNPKTFNEKLCWLKIHDHNPLYSKLADKYESKSIISSIIGEQYIVPNYGVWNNVEYINIDSLPEQFVLKCTSDSSGAIICKDKKTFDFDKAKKTLAKNMSGNLYYSYREWVYKKIKPRIIADKYLDDHTGKELQDYKFWCFNGVPKYMYCTIKSDSVYENFYDMAFNIVGINHGFPRRVPEFEKPTNFGLMKELAAKISKNIPFVRVDFFDVDGRVYFGECTFYDWGGVRPFVDYEMDIQLGELIVLPIDKK